MRTASGTLNLPFLRHAGQIGAFEQFHRHVDHLAFVADVVDGHDARMRESSRRPGFLGEAGLVLLAIGIVRRNDDGLDGERPVEHRVFGFVDDAHRPPAEFAEDPVASYRLQFLRCHDVGMVAQDLTISESHRRRKKPRSSPGVNAISIVATLPGRRFHLVSERGVALLSHFDHMPAGVEAQFRKRRAFSPRHAVHEYIAVRVDIERKHAGTSPRTPRCRMSSRKTTAPVAKAIIAIAPTVARTLRRRPRNARVRGQHFVRAHVGVGEHARRPQGTPRGEAQPRIARRGKCAKRSGVRRPRNARLRQRCRSRRRSGAAGLRRPEPAAPRHG